MIGQLTGYSLANFEGARLRLRLERGEALSPEEITHLSELNIKCFAQVEKTKEIAKLYNGPSQIVFMPKDVMKRGRMP